MQDTITENEIRIADNLRDRLVVHALDEVDANYSGLTDEERVELAVAHTEKLTATYLRLFLQENGREKTQRMIAALEATTGQG